MIALGPGEILSNREAAPDYWWMRIDAPAIAAAAKPGQFVHVKCGPGDNPLLRRPMSIGRVDRAAGTFDILYKVVGTGTRLMTRMDPGYQVDILGPLGIGFSFPAGFRRAAVLGRGIGMAPLIFWSEEAVARGYEIHAFISGRTAAMCFGAEELAALGIRVYAGSDDGGGVGSDRLLSLFPEVCRAAGIQFALTCGSRRMSRLVVGLDQEGLLYGEISLEAQMACAMGACRGCTCEVHDAAQGDGPHYALVCQDGPVFPARKVVLA